MLERILERVLERVLERKRRAQLACAFVLLCASSAVAIACSSSSSDAGSSDTGGNGGGSAANGDASIGSGNTGTGVMTGSDAGVSGSTGGACAPNGDAVRTTAFDFVGADAAADAGGCTGAQIDALEAACYPGTDQACAAFFADPANAACNDCVYGPVDGTDPNLLPPIYNWTEPDGGAGALTYVNVGGCIAVYAPSEMACAEAEALASGCESDQCNGCALQASATDTVYNAEYAALSGCFADAAATACAPMESTVQMCTLRLDVGSPDAGVASCFHLVDGNGFFTAAVWSYLKLACVGPGTRAVADAGDEH